MTSLDKRARRVGLSIKALEMVEKEAVAQYGSSDSGFGDIGAR